MLRLKALVLLSTVLVVGCPTTSMLPETSEVLLPPPKREQFASRSQFSQAIAQYQTYLESYRSALTNEVKAEHVHSTCAGVVIAKSFVLPPPPSIVSETSSGQLDEVLNYVDTIRAAANTHNQLLRAQIELFETLCPSVDKYVLP